MSCGSIEISVPGVVPDHVLAEVMAALDSGTSTVEHANTVLTATVADQAALLGMLARIHDLGLTLSEVRRLSDRDRGGEADPSTRADRGRTNV